MTYTSLAQIRLTQDEYITYLTIDNMEKNNALTIQMWDSLSSLLEEVNDDAGCRLLVLQGAGEHAFAAGSDISEFGERRSTPEGVALYSAIYARAIGQLQTMGMPVVARIKGHCIGAGMALAMHCDLRYASENAIFSIPAGKLGLGYQHLWLQRLNSLVGPAKAKEIMFTAARYDAQAAVSMGLVNAISSDAEFIGITETICAMAPLSLKASKIAIDQANHPDRYDQQVCDMAIRSCFASRDYLEGQAAFKEKRKPAFTGL